PPPQSLPESFEVDLEAIEIAPAGKLEFNISSGAGFSSSDGEYLPIVKVQAVYPRRAERRGIGGHCIVEYTVTRSGSVNNPVPVDCQPQGIFEKASVTAAMKFKYKPRVVDGEAIAVAGVRNKFTFLTAE
ncbi:energy transducer TonB, partial [Endozoicomonas sp. OPT23]|uniref:energy transducer TonB n=1 Tax=Endozoicomonas sp. OPT23 TaxID=2072845 RepID=UPI001E5EB1DC